MLDSVDMALYTVSTMDTTFELVTAAALLIVVIRLHYRVRRLENVVTHGKTELEWADLQEKSGTLAMVRAGRAAVKVKVDLPDGRAITEAVTAALESEGK